jgi:simple sugar transport system ATP-binding protein
MNDIVKRYGDLVASDHVDFEVEHGEVHALLGENGAGKTTLMNILYGLVQPDKGEIRIDGEIVRLNGPGSAIEAGVGMVHQHPLLVGRLSVLENLFLGGVGNGTERGLREAIAEVEERFSLDLDPRAMVEDLPMSQRQRIEIVRCLSRGVRVLVLDEPTAVLTVDEVGNLFAEMRLLKEAGHSVIFISHKLSEVSRIADRVTVLRKGAKEGTYITAETNNVALTQAMVGEQVTSAERRGTAAAGSARLRLDGCTVAHGSEPARLSEVNLDVCGGEIVGVAGVEGNGQAPLAALTQGMARPNAGEVLFDDKPLPPISEWRQRGIGIGRIPEDRSHQGLTLDATLWENLQTGPQAPPERRIFNKRKVVENARVVLEEFGVSPPDPFLTAGQLSGGNQQKVVFARELQSDPGVVVAVNPTRGLDLRAQKDVHQRLLGLRDRGVAVLIISTDLDEVTALSDRIGVLYSGRLEGPFSADSVDRRQIGLLMAGLSRDDAPPSVAEGLL